MQTAIGGIDHIPDHRYGGRLSNPEQICQITSALSVPHLARRKKLDLGDILALSHSRTSGAKLSLRHSVKPHSKSPSGH
jgi:hypothetical protein